MNKQNVTVIGQGYVGLPLAVALAEAGHTVVGIDLNAQRVEFLNSGVSPVEDIRDSELQAVIGKGLYSASADFAPVAQADVVLICVPTPINSDAKPDLAPLVSSVKSIAEFIKTGSMVVLESTVAPGCTREYVHDLLLQESGLKSEEIDIAFSPERIDPSNKTWNVKNTPKLVAGLTTQATSRAADFYKSFVSEVNVFDSVEVVETAKLLENSFRLINISFINEIALFCEKLGIDVGDVIAAANTKPYGFMPFYPSVGIGGHCIPVDPMYLLSKASEIGASADFIALAHQINQNRPLYFAHAASLKLGGLSEKKILVVGVAYKPNVADVRETPVEALIDALRLEGAHVSWNDDLVKDWRGESTSEISSDFDLAILANIHDGTDLSLLGNIPIIDTRVGKK